MEGLVKVTYVSEWDHTRLVKTKAIFNWNTGEVTDIEVSNEDVEGIPTRQYIEFEDGTELDIDEDRLDYSETDETFVAHDVVISSDKTERGYIIGEDEEADCGVESCTGTNHKVYWRDGQVTICCSKGMAVDSNDVFHIIG